MHIGLEKTLSNLRIAQLNSPQKVWQQLPCTQKAAVLALLHPCLSGKLCCAITIRTSNISYGGDAALPGGRPNDGTESTWQTALREAYEEIGVDLRGCGERDDVSVEHINTMPGYLSSRNLMVVPEIAFLNLAADCIPKEGRLPRLLSNRDKWNANEVNTAFSVPLEKFLQPQGHSSRFRNWHGLRYHQHKFELIPFHKQVGDPGSFVIWGLTASILIDIARVAYKQEPAWKHRRPGEFGDQELIDSVASHMKASSPSLNFTDLLGPRNSLLNSRASHL